MSKNTSKKKVVRKSEPIKVVKKEVIDSDHIKISYSNGTEQIISI